ncbi:NAD(P)H oxidoreductase [Alginatibacterium sediminis]|uniref:NAD(P)H oxidoreductase n=1 Tax=Alginatibacterium sediminis TaxID=2164068 RepID=A0A420E6D0_9ALTE|nr:NAD(P)H-dependent oxidoreductase [Alginatibacterium sediminis]RKF12799.1 NAD(P)H oxidoreductase [Alginatibacterium sediminis]
MKRILLILAHPALQKSTANASLLKAAQGLDNVTVHDLYQVYPDSFIDVAREQALLQDHDIIVFQYPFYWYSCPAIVHEWTDLVLEYGFAYGENATALQGKDWLCSVSCGGSFSSYNIDGYNEYPLIQFFLPFRQTAKICGMRFLPPFVLDGIHKRASKDRLQRKSQLYKQLLIGLSEGSYPEAEIHEATFLNQLEEHHIPWDKHARGGHGA